MPKHSRPDVVRMEIYLPPDLAADVDRRAGEGGRNAYIVRCLARASRMKVQPVRRGRPPKPAPAP